MVISTESALDLENTFSQSFDDAVVYGDAGGETVLHEGPVVVRPNGWVEVPSGRLLSPSAVHHVDPAAPVGDEPDRDDGR